MTARVLGTVDLIPAGRVASYGDIAALAATGPRQVGPHVDAGLAHAGAQAVGSGGRGGGGHRDILRRGSK